jgi:hypothetical protein
MTIYLQIIALVIFIIAGFGLGRWIWESHRPISTPEQLSPILIHGISETDTKALADAIAIGITGRIAEHTRTVAFINEAATSTEGTYDIRALTRISQPAPSLIQAAHTPEALDIAVEFAGSKVETKGLQSILSFDSQKRGALSISLLLEKRDGKLTGLASSIFPPNNAYGFAVPIEGSVREIAESIAMRFIQAHYAAEDPFYSALDPQDFQMLWKIRRRAAEIAIRASGGSATSEEDPIKKEAKAAYNEIAHLVRRYTRRPEFQKLGAYLASVSEDFEQAKIHMQLVKQLSKDANEISALDQMIVALETDAGTRLAKATPVSVPPDLLAEQAGVSKLELSVLAEPALKSAGIAAFADQVRSTESARTPDLILVLGAFDGLAPFADRISPLDDRDYDPKDNLLSHTQNVASLIATLAPTARIRVVKALSGNGAGTKAGVIAAVDRAVAVNPEIIVLPLGPFDTEADKSMLERAGKQSLVLVAAGNDGKELVRSKANVPGVLYVGAASGEQKESYSNFGEGVDIFAPGSVLTFDNSGKVERMNGTSFSVAIAAAVAANIAALEMSRLSPAELEQQLLRHTISSASGKILKVSMN